MEHAATMASSTLKIAAIPGDGTGPEVTVEAIKVLDAVAALDGFAYDVEMLDWGGDRYLKTGEIIPEGGLELLRSKDAIFLGAIGHPGVQPGILEKGLLLDLRFKLDQYINLRPVKLLPGVETPLAGRGPKDIDFVVVRENTEDMYCGIGGFLKKGTPDEVAVQQAVYTRKGCERCIRWAFDYTRKRNSPKKTLTLVAKTNVLTYGHDLWWRTFQEVAKDYPDVKTDYNHVDACCMWMVKNPDAYDVIVTTNMFGDIITDLGGILQGGWREHVRADGGQRAQVHRPERDQSDRRHQRDGDAPGAQRPPPVRRPHRHGRGPRHGHEDEEPGRWQDGLRHTRGGRPRRSSTQDSLTRSPSV